MKNLNYIYIIAIGLVSCENGTKSQESSRSLKTQQPEKMPIREYTTEISVSKNEDFRKAGENKVVDVSLVEEKFSTNFSDEELRDLPKFDINKVKQGDYSLSDEQIKEIKKSIDSQREVNKHANQ